MRFCQYAKSIGYMEWEKQMRLAWHDAAKYRRLQGNGWFRLASTGRNNLNHYNTIGVDESEVPSLIAGEGDDEKIDI